MTPGDVWNLVNQIEVPGANRDDPVIQALRAVDLGVFGHVAINEAKERRALILKHHPCSIEWHGPTRYVWGWWCAAATWPEVIAQETRDSFRVTVDLGPWRRKWSVHALPWLGQLMAQCELADGFLISIDTLEIDGLDITVALELTKRLVELLKDRRSTLAIIPPRT